MASDMSLVSSVTFQINWDAAHTVDLNDSINRYTHTFTYELANGTGADQADQIWWDNRTVGLGANDDLDLAGVLLNCFGIVSDFDLVKLVYVEHLSTSNSTGITVGGGGVTEWIMPFAAAGDKTANIAAGGHFLAFRPDATGFNVVGGATDILQITNNDGANAADYRVVIIGVST